MAVSLEPLTLAEILPSPQVRERHERFIKCPPAAAWSALLELRLLDVTVARALMDLRTLPARLAGLERPRACVTGRFMEEGLVPVLVAN